MPRAFFLLIMILAGYDIAGAQCCAGGSGCTVAGGISQGVLAPGVLEIDNNLQWIQSDHFYQGDQRAEYRTFDSFESWYDYFRLAYGVTDRLTMSLESGYYLQKKETGLNGDPVTTYTSQGIGDLVIFPRYDIVQRQGPSSKTEVLLGLGYKIPLGSYNDSVARIEPFSGNTYFVTKPSTVQLSSGAQDIIFYTFLFHHFVPQNLRVFANAMYVKKGWNPNGERLGDFMSVAVFAGKTFFKKMGTTIQLRYEWLDRMQINQSILYYGKPTNYFPEATGYRKVFLTPQVSYTKGVFSAYVSADIPLYQYLHSTDLYTQAGSQYQVTAGVSFRIKTGRDPAKVVESGMYYCPMHPEVTNVLPSTCPICGMALEKKQ